jgi:hypothetical protein
LDKIKPAIESAQALDINHVNQNQIRSSPWVEWAVWVVWVVWVAAWAVVVVVAAAWVVAWAVNRSPYCTQTSENGIIMMPYSLPKRESSRTSMWRITPSR